VSLWTPACLADSHVLANSVDIDLGPDSPELIEAMRIHDPLERLTA
jgi:hypothetical protein